MFFFCKQKTAYEMRISDWSSDVCSSDLRATVLDFAVDGARDFGPERASGANIYESVVKHLGNLRKNGQNVVLASYSIGARERLAGLLADHDLRNVRQADTWHEALGKAETHVALIVLPLATDVTATDVALLPAQDTLYARRVRRARHTQHPEPLQAQLATL